MSPGKLTIISFPLIACLALAYVYRTYVIPALPPNQGSVTLTPTFAETTTVTPSQGSPSLPANLGRQTKTSGCVSKDALPDTECTPGAIFPDATVQQICTSGYSSQVRNVPDSKKNQVYAEYGITQRSPGQYEVDHLISLELGGSNDTSNLWPEPAEPRPGFHEKDKVENYLHDQVCSGAISLQQAQTEIATNWLAVYQQMPGK